MNAIEVDNLSKIYRLGYTGTGSLRDDIAGWWANLRGRPNPNAVVAETNIRSDRNSQGFVYALKDIDLRVEEGEVLGIIGRNGAGKSTLLKILTRITGPTTGTIRMNGRVGSLLEVGTGFNGELSGRENIFLNGAILGMRKQEIERKFFDIVEFAGVAKYIDTPVKRYSSGMRVRLGFAVAAFLEPEILIIDEVLAVGDAEFQERAIGKMQEVSAGGKRTVLFVSHNMNTIRMLCSRAILLEDGVITERGSTDKIVSDYLADMFHNKSAKIDLSSNETRNKIYIHRAFHEIKLLNANGELQTTFELGDKIIFEISFESENLIASPNIVIGVVNKFNQHVCSFASNAMVSKRYSIGKQTVIRCVWEKCLLSPGRYYFNISLRKFNTVIDKVTKVASFDILTKDIYGSKNTEFDSPIFIPEASWEVDNPR